jgi:hypothetical protein
VKAEVRTAIRARATAKLDLKLLTHEQALYAVIDRALLFAELENSWWRSARHGLGYVALPACFVSLLLWFVSLPWWAIVSPVAIAMLILGGCWLRDLLVLAREGIDARTVRSMSEAVQALTPEVAPNPPPRYP